MIAGPPRFYYFLCLILCMVSTSRILHGVPGQNHLAAGFLSLLVTAHLESVIVAIP